MFQTFKLVEMKIHSVNNWWPSYVCKMDSLYGIAYVFLFFTYLIAFTSRCYGTAAD